MIYFFFILHVHHGSIEGLCPLFSDPQIYDSDEEPFALYGTDRHARKRETERQRDSKREERDGKRKERNRSGDL